VIIAVISALLILYVVFMPQNTRGNYNPMPPNAKRPDPPPAPPRKRFP
jgi:hypothetical protein